MKTHIEFRRIQNLALLLGLITSNLSAQPYVDPIQIRYTHNFENQNSEVSPYKHIWAGSDTPFVIKNNTYFLLSPYFELWQIDSFSDELTATEVQSVAIAAGIILPLKNPKWALTVLPILRWNGEKFLQNNSIQFGSIAFASYTIKPDQKFRFGVYVNKEFFGLFVMPLLGVDWQINERNYLFGILPGRLSYEHQINKNLYWGVTFRAVTNSYRLKNSQFLRLDDNQLSLYLDYYPVNNLCVTLEPGIGVFRKIRTGIDSRDYLSSLNWGDGPLLRLSASYRVRL